MNKSIFFILISLSIGCHKHSVPVQYEILNKKIDRQTEVNDNSLKKYIKPYKHDLDSIMNEVIANVETELKKNPIESTLGNWIGDAMMWYSKEKLKDNVDFAMMNYGGMRLNSIPIGPLKLGKIYELMPFENYLSIVELDGISLLNLVQQMSSKGGWPISKELRYVINNENSCENIFLNGLEVEKHKTYKILMTDYLVNGGDDLDVLKGKKSTITDILLRDALIEYCKDHNNIGESISSMIDGRVVQKK